MCRETLAYSRHGRSRQVKIYNFLLADSIDFVCFCCRIFDLKKRRELGILSLGQREDAVGAVAVTTMAFDDVQEPKHVLTGSRDGRLHLVRAKDWQPLLELGKHTSRKVSNSISAIAIHPGKPLALSSDGWTWRAWNLATGKTLAPSETIPVPKKSRPVGELLKWSPCGKYLLVAGEEGLAVFSSEDLSKPLWHQEIPKKMGTLLTATIYYSDEDEKLKIAWAGEGSIVRIHDSLTGKIQQTIDAQLEPRIKCLGVIEGHLVLVSSSGSIRVYSLSDLNVCVAKHDADLRITCMALSSND